MEFLYGVVIGIALTITFVVGWSFWESRESHNHVTVEEVKVWIRRQFDDYEEKERDDPMEMNSEQSPLRDRYES